MVVSQLGGVGLSKVKLDDLKARVFVDVSVEPGIKLGWAGFIVGVLGSEQYLRAFRTVRSKKELQMTIRHVGRIFLASLLLLTACGSPTAGSGFGEVANKPEQHTADGGQEAQPTPAGGGVQPVVATSELVVGANRLAIGLLQNNVPISDAAQTQVKARYFKINGGQATVTGEEAARYYGEGLGSRGSFILHPAFDAAGTWGLEVQIQRPGKPLETPRIALEVKEKGSAPALGSEPPRTKTPTAQDVKDLKTITSATTPDPRLYQLSVDQAIGAGKPSLILFATPGFCETAVCGPSVQVLSRLKDTFGDKINAVHVEVYQYPFEKLQPVAAMQAWGLQSEPWLFIVGKDGKIAGRYEGGITFQELEPDVAKALQ